MKILNEHNSTLLNRKEYTIELDHPKKATPKTEEVKKEVSSFLKTSEDLITIKHIYTVYGQNSSKVIAHVYEKKEQLEIIEFKKKHPRKKKAKQKKAQQGAK